jgi:hypothetical protein
VPPTAHDSSDAGPAISAAFNAPNSQPEPITEPIAVNSSPIVPMSRRIRWSSPAAPTC